MGCHLDVRQKVRRKSGYVGMIIKRGELGMLRAVKLASWSGSVGGMMSILQIVAKVRGRGQ